MTWRTITVNLDGVRYDLEVRGEPSLAPRWWRWTETAWTRDASGIAFETIVGDHRVLFVEMRYPTTFDPYMLAFAEDGRAMLLVPMSAFAITDDTEAQDGAAAAYRAAVERHAAEPSLL